ncbi:MAG: zinc-ribbon domain-containing protein [Candidatus Methanofastidiosia archaeon]
MKCRNCGKEISEEFRYCPFCGFNKRVEELSFSDEMLRDFEKRMMHIGRMLGMRISAREKGKNLIVSVEFQGRKMAFKVEPLEIERKGYQLKPTQVVRDFKKTIEPEGEISYFGNKIYLKINLPPIPERDIDITKLEDSVEVRAYKNKTRYFKLFQVPENYRIMGKEFTEKGLIVTLEKGV